MIKDGQNQKKMGQASYDPASLFIRKAEETDTPYIISLARREIGVTPRRLNRHKSCLVHLNHKTIGFVSYCRFNQVNLYVYMMAFEKEAQNHGLARPVLRWVIAREEKLSPIEGIMFRIYKTNRQALHATLVKYNYNVIKELPKHYVLYKKWPPPASPNADGKPVPG